MIIQSVDVDVSIKWLFDSKLLVQGEEIFRINSENNQEEYNRGKLN